MPTAIPQNSLNTTSDGTGTNVQSELTPESFFFLEKDKFYSQTAANKFGIVETGAASTFRNFFLNLSINAQSYN